MIETAMKEAGINNLTILVNAIQQTNHFFLEQVQRQVNRALTVRNWIIGFYIAEYEQQGQDRAAYGNKMLENLANRLKQKGFKGMAETNLKLFRLFYNCYPQIRQSVTDELKKIDLQIVEIRQTVSDESKVIDIVSNSQSYLSPELLISRLSFSHFIELLKSDTALQRSFYEVEAVKNNWSVRELQRAMNSMLFERTGLSNDKQAVLEKHRNGSGLKPEDIFRSPYLLDFLGLEEKATYAETDMEQAITNHLQNFLLEMGRGFCFEARQKRITFDNTHYRIDLVFYHRILKCHILLDLKIGEFTHADAGQMNVYLNYYKENEIQPGDNLPVGIILCAGKNETLVKYATMGLPQQVFVSKYLVNLPSETELEKIIEEEQQKIQ